MAMFRFAGQIAFGALVRLASPPDVRALGELRSIACQGLALEWDPRHADVAWRNGVLAVAIGRARDGTDRGASEAARWLERYASRRERATDDVSGAFAIVVVDSERHRVLAAVDRFAIEPLAYRCANGVLGFSDRACDVPGSARRVSRQSLYDYLFFHVIPAPATVYDDVLRVEAAHRLVVTPHEAALTRYWTPRFMENDITRLDERMHAFVATVRQAVGDEAGDATTACFLSGGTDSSTVAGMLTEVRGAPAHAYSIGFDAVGYDEMAYARIAARHFDLAHDEYYLTPDDVAAAVPALAASFDQPFGNSSVVPAYFCALRARKDGFTRMLAGDGGDELFGGNSRYALQKAFEPYHRLPRGLRHAVLEPLACRSPLFTRVPGLRKLGGYVRHARADMPDRLNAFNLLQYVGVDTVLDPQFCEGIDPEHPIERQREVWSASHAASLVNRMLEYDWKFTLADNDLPKVRLATQAAGIDVGYPFLVHGVVDLSLDLPARWKVRGLALRWFFKRALRDFLPVEILRKKKHGFGMPFGTWLVYHAPLRALAEDALRAAAARGIVRPQAVAHMLDTQLPKAPGYYGELVWILMMLELWLRAHEAGARFGHSPAAVAEPLIADASS